MLAGQGEDRSMVEGLHPVNPVMALGTDAAKGQHVAGDEFRILQRMAILTAEGCSSAGQRRVAIQAGDGIAAHACRMNL